MIRWNLPDNGPDLSLLWDGETETAEVRVNGIVLTGAGSDAERAFRELQGLQRRMWDAEARLRAVGDLVERLNREVPR